MTPTQEKRVACLYRVSTTKQIDDNDIPLQQNACRKLVSQHDGWSIIDEYVEKGVSGYKTSIQNRDEIQRALRDAKSGKYDVLLVFTTDRLCRIHDDYTPTLKAFSKYVEVWTCDKGNITIKTHTDALIASIDGWNNEAESIKISIRTDEKHKQMTEDGEFRGGSNPYGYKFVKSGKFSKRDKKQRKELFDMVIDEQESEVVKLIFNLAYEYGYGGNRIASHLNSNGILTRSGVRWIMPTINYMLRNPIYKGYPAYGKKTCKKVVGEQQSSQRNQPEDQWIVSSDKVESLAIIEEHVWDAVKLNRQSRNPFEDRASVNLPTKGQLLFVGFIRCGHCGSPLCTTQHVKQGKNSKKISLKYRCSGKQSGKTNCDGGSIYAQNKIEDQVIDNVMVYMSELGRHDFSNEYAVQKESEIKTLQKKLQDQNALKEKKHKEIAVLQDEIPKSIMGDSPFTKEQLADLIKRKTTELEDLRVEIIALEQVLMVKQSEILDADLVQNLCRDFSTLFQDSTIERKKMILSKIIDEVIVFKDRIKIKYKLHIQELSRTILGVQNNIKWESSLYKNTYPVYIEKLVEVFYQAS